MQPFTFPASRDVVSLRTASIANNAVVVTTSCEFCSKLLSLAPFFLTLKRGGVILFILMALGTPPNVWRYVITGTPFGKYFVNS